MPSRLIDSCFPPINCKPRHSPRELLYKLFTPLTTLFNSLRSITMVRRSFPLFLQSSFHLFNQSRVKTSWRDPARPPLLSYLSSPPNVRFPSFTRARYTFLRLFHLFPNLSFNFPLNSLNHLSLIHHQYSSNYAVLHMIGRPTQPRRNFPKPFDPLFISLPTSPLSRPPLTSQLKPTLPSTLLRLPTYYLTLHFFSSNFHLSNLLR